MALLDPAAAGLDRDRRRRGPRRRPGAGDRLGRPAARLPARRRPPRTGPERAAADPARRSPCSGRRLPAARDRDRLGGRAADRLRRLQRRQPAEERPGPLAAARLRPATAGRSAAGAATPTRPGAAPRRATAAARLDPRTGADGRRSSATAPAAAPSPPRRGSAAGADAGRADHASRSPATRSATPPAPTWRRRRSAPTAACSPPSQTVGGDARRSRPARPALHRQPGREPASSRPTRARYAELLGSAAGPAGLPGAGLGRRLRSAIGASVLRVGLRRLPGAARHRRRARRDLDRRDPRRGCPAPAPAPTTPSTAAAPGAPCGSS